MTAQPIPTSFTADAFLAWAADQRQSRFELICGRPVAMAPERAGHARAKARAYRAFEAAAIARERLDCEAFPDGMSVRVNEATVYEPDVLVRCGPRTPDDAIEIADPLVLVEVLLRSSKSIDTGAKLGGYFSLASVRHYLVNDSDGRSIVHHQRDETGSIHTRILRGGRLAVDPPGLSLDVAQFFSPL